MMKAELLLRHEDIIGEGPLWHARLNRLYWIDIFGKKINMLDWVSRRTESRNLPFSPGAVISGEGDSLFIAHDASVASYSWVDDTLIEQAALDGDTQWVRFNDGKCDPKGRFICGTVDKYDEMTRVLGMTVDAEPSGPRGKLYSFAGFKNRPNILEEDITTSNGLAWNKDGSVFYYIDTPTQQVVKYDYNIEEGTISGKSIFYSVPAEWGSPDGMTIDVEGNIYLALWDGWKVLKIDSRGRLSDEISTPVKRPTSCAFAGPELDTLVITSASMRGHIEDDDSELGGSLFSIKTESRGFSTPLLRL